MSLQRTTGIAGNSDSGSLSRRRLLLCVIGSCFGTIILMFPQVAAEEKTPARFGLATVKEMAQALARRPFQEPAALPDVLKKLTYDQYRLIAFRHERALWREPPLPFWGVPSPRLCVQG